MGQLGISEMLVIFIIALLVFGPKKLPELGKSLGKGIREFRKATEDLKSSWDEQMRDVENPIKEVTRDIQQSANDMKKDLYESSEPPATPEPAPAASETAAVPSPHASETAIPKEHV